MYLALEVVLGTIGRADLPAHANVTLEMLTNDNPFSSARAREELGWSPTIPPDNGMPDALRCWKAHHGSAYAMR
jgi:nucleoside-diphosphate-sugar epimerase